MMAPFGFGDAPACRKRRRRRWPTTTTEDSTLEPHDNQNETDNGQGQRCGSQLRGVRESKRTATWNETVRCDNSSSIQQQQQQQQRPLHTPLRKSMLLVMTTGLWYLLATLSLLVFGIALTDTVDAFRPTTIANRQQRFRLSLPMSLATPPSSTTTATTSIPNKTELESMKVVDLKQLIKDSGFNERGLLSKLKKKQDLVDFLSDKKAGNDATATRVVVQKPAEPLPGASNVRSIPPKPKKPIKLPLSMPKPKPSSRANGSATAGSGQESMLDSEQRQRQSPMEELFERVHEQYPPLKYLCEGNSTLLGELDVRQRYHPMLQAGNTVALSESELQDHESNDDESPAMEPIRSKPALSGDMDLIFVGTASCTPSITRGVSCTAMRLHSLASGTSVSNKKKKQQHSGKQQSQQSSNSQSNLGTWLFDCGESTQLQIQKTSSIRPSRITKIFVTHSHGDHSFGLPGLLCIMGQDKGGGANEAGERGPKPPIDIYGPEGLRMWLRTAIRYSVSRIVPKYRVHELKDVAMAPEWGYSPKWEKFYFNKAAYYERTGDTESGNKHNGYNTNNNRHHRNQRYGRSGGGSNTEYYWGAANDKRKESLRYLRRNGKQSTDWMSLCDQGVPGIEASEFYGEVEGGRDIYPIYDHPLSSDGAPVWEVENEGSGDDDSGVKVYAAPMSHGVPCVGYVVQEANRPGRLRDELVKPICERNIPALKEAGFRHPMKALAVIKDLPEGGSFTFPDGTVVTQEEAVEPTRPGRKVVILGDTNSARALTKLAENADVVVHEATNTFLSNYDHRDSTVESVNRDAIFHGHSTPYIAGNFAKAVKAKRLILNHFSARYTGDQSLESISIMSRIEEQAMKASGLSKSHVAAAWDFMIFPVPKPEKNTTVDDHEDGVSRS